MRPALLALALLPALAHAQQVPAQPGAPVRTIHVSGEAHVSVRPDVAVVFAGVTATGKDLAPVTGYTVVDEARVTVRDLAKVGPVLDRVLAAGSNTLRSLSFEKDDPTPEQARALAAAYASARAKAEALARAAGVTLGEVVTVSAGGQVRPFPMVRSAMAMDKAAGAPVSPGEVEIGASVDVTFAIR